MSTVILMWNPAISSFKESHFEEFVRQPSLELNWSIREHDKVSVGDTFYLLRVGVPPTGVVIKGVVDSLPFRDEDWSGRGRETYYCWLAHEAIVNPYCVNVLTTSQLQLAMPDFKWDGGSSGRMLPPAYEGILEDLWDKYLSENSSEIHGEGGFIRSL